MDPLEHPPESESAREQRRTHYRVLAQEARARAARETVPILISGFIRLAEAYEALAEEQGLW
jgi:hypothetical protein